MLCWKMKEICGKCKCRSGVLVDTHCPASYNCNINTYSDFCHDIEQL